jgi:hypothetical protein
MDLITLASSKVIIQVRLLGGAQGSSCGLFAFEDARLKQEQERRKREGGSGA